MMNTIFYKNGRSRFSCLVPIVEEMSVSPFSTVLTLSLPYLIANITILGSVPFIPNFFKNFYL